MPVDTSKLRKLGRRGLGAPPTDGSPGIDDRPAPGPETSVSQPGPPPLHLDFKDSKATAAVTLPTQNPELAVHLPPAQTYGAKTEMNGAGQEARAPERDEDLADSTPRQGFADGQGRGQPAAAERHQRVPPPELEPRIPFTTRIAASTKERLEDACYHLRIKHQAFIDEAIRLHLKKHGF